MDNKTIYFAKTHENAIIPSKREEDGAFDIYSCFDENFYILKPHQTRLIPTGISSAFSTDYVLIIKERGSTGSRGMGVRAGVIDSGYRGQWFVAITNHNDKPLVIAKENVSEKEYCAQLTGSRDITADHIVYPYEKAIAQCVLVEIPKLKIKEITYDKLMQFESERGTGALGSSKK